IACVFLVVAYQGEAVTLSSGGDPSRELASIKWYVFSNQTWIATFHGGKINTERFYLFRGRLTLNASSGDLTIRNVSRRDAVDFSVELVDTEKRSLTAVCCPLSGHLQIPSIRTLFSVHLDGGCWVGLDCLSPDLDANLSWTLEPPLPTAYAMADPSGKGGVLLASLASRDTAHFTCTSSRKPENVSDSIRVACKAPPTDTADAVYTSRFGNGAQLSRSLSRITIRMWPLLSLDDIQRNAGAQP
uniref:Ig-like domain-containing protein n=1 Tax=Hippocampus comes TaxID=109280 RepID=A0A3Q2YAM0_HIPCM